MQRAEGLSLLVLRGRHLSSRRPADAQPKEAKPDEQGVAELTKTTRSRLFPDETPVRPVARASHRRQSGSETHGEALPQPDGCGR